MQTPCFAMTKKANKYFQVNNQSFALPKKAHQSLHDRKNVDLLVEKVIEADKGDFDAQQSWVARHLRAIAKEAR